MLTMLRRTPVRSSVSVASARVRMRPALSAWPTHSTRSISSSTSLSASAQQEPATKKKSAVVPDLDLDPSFDALLGDMQMRSPYPRAQVREALEYEEAPVAKGFGIRREAAEGEEEEYADRREERRSPAMVLGTKKIGMVVLPDGLVKGVQDAIEATEDKRDVRFAYLELLKPVLEKAPGGSRNLPQHAVARASAFLPAQYAATYNVLEELNTRVGGITGPFLEVSGGLGPGIWAASEVFGTDALKDSTLVHRTRFGLDLAREFAKNIPNTEIDFKRDLTSVAMPTPKVTLATFALSVLPTARSRADLLQHLLDTDAEHIVLVDLSGEAGWTAMKQARKWFLAQSTESSPLHITAPCPHDGVCPRIDMLEPCAFSQRVQRPAFTRKTKHAKRGEEDVTYSYLIVSRGKRPSGPHGLEAGTGRMGAVGKEAMARALAKLSGRTEMREVEGGEGELEVVELPLPEGVTPIVEDADPEATRAALAAEAYSWPRLVAPPMKRSGHVVMDACTVNERLERFTVAKSLGKQSYYDARKSGWGDLWPHGFKGAVERKRGIRRLTDPNVEDLNLPSEREEAPVATATEMDVDSIIADLAKTALVKGDGGIDDVFEASYNFDFDAARDKAKAQSKLHRPTEAEKERGREREKREKAKERKAKLRNARLDKSERRQWRDADTRTVREFEAELDENTAPPPRAADLGEGMQGMGEALGRGRKRRGPGFPFNTFVRGLHTSSRALSVAPGSSSASPSAASARQKVTVSSLQAQHVARDPITMLTAYDFPTALLCARAGIDIILVGDSMAQVCLGYDTTLPLTLDETIHHTRAVARGAGASFLLVDMPFGYVAGSLDSAVAAAVRLVKEGGADGLKIEGGREIAPLVSRLASFGVPVMPHIGLQPQRVGVTGYRAQGRNAAAAADMIAVAREMEAAGAFALLIEAVPHHVGSAVAEAVNIPTIGIGAGPNTSGQVLVLTDVVGTLDVGPEAGAPDVEPKLPKFVRQFGAAGRESRRAVDAYIAEVKARTYPAPPKETYGMPKEELEEFRRLLKDMGLGKAKETVGESKA